MKILIAIIIILFGLTSYGGYRYFLMAKEQKLATETNLNLEKKIKELEETLSFIDNEKNSLSSEVNSLSSELGAEKNKSVSYEEKITEITNTVDTLKKLSETDKELLQKYSKVYFLNENYVPESLSKIDTKYLTDQKEELEFHARAYPYLLQMLDASKRDGVNITINSAYRSFGEQTGLKASYKSVFGSGANKFSADQGYSEHQLGTTLDFSAPSLKGSLEGFEKTPEYKWLKEHSYKFGFILSYPEGNNFYVFEPWHWRFIGTSLASRLQTESKNFYDLDQRIIDTYLIKIFDQI